MSQALHVVCPHCDAVNRVPEERLADGGNCGRCKEKLFVGAPLALDPARFAAHVGRSDLPLVIDFWAPWCGPCRTMEPAFAEAARRLEPHARLVKVNTEDHPDLAGRFGIRSIPTIVVLKHGHEAARQSGAMDLATLERWIRGQL